MLSRQNEFCADVGLASINALQGVVKRLGMLVQEREGLRLLRPLTNTLHKRGIPVHHAIFAPADSSYMSLARAGGKDTAWQQALRDMWQCEFAAKARIQVNHILTSRQA